MPLSRFAERLSPEEDIAPLFDSVRKSLAVFLSQGRVSYPIPTGDTRTGSCGVFVSLIDKSGTVRGSMGFLGTPRQLNLAAIDCAIAAASEDPRYRHIKLEELHEITVEITLIRQVSGPHTDPAKESEAFCTRNCGLYVEGAINAGVLLPREIRVKSLDISGALALALKKAGISSSEKELKWYMFNSRVFVQEGGQHTVTEVPE